MHQSYYCGYCDKVLLHRDTQKARHTMEKSVCVLYIGLQNFTLQQNSKLHVHIIARVLQYFYVFIL